MDYSDITPNEMQRLFHGQRGDEKIILPESSNTSKKTAFRYQAVFLDNGQVYFGKLEQRAAPTFMKLTDIFYLQSAENEDVVQLIKLGSELHGPEDVMYIQKAHILFWENLRPDSEIIGKIRKYYNA